MPGAEHFTCIISFTLLDEDSNNLETSGNLTKVTAHQDLLNDKAETCLHCRDVLGNSDRVPV